MQIDVQPIAGDQGIDVVDACLPEVPDELVQVQFRLVSDQRQDGLGDGVR